MVSAIIITGIYILIWFILQLMVIPVFKPPGGYYEPFCILNLGALYMYMERLIFRNSTYGISKNTYICYLLDSYFGSQC